MNAKNICHFQIYATILHAIDFQLFQLFHLMWIFSTSTKTHHFHIKLHDLVDINSLLNEKSYQYTMSDWSDNNHNSSRCSLWPGSDRTLSVSGYVKREVFNSLFNFNFNIKKNANLKKRGRRGGRKKRRKKERKIEFCFYSRHNNMCKLLELKSSVEEHIV